MSNYVTFLITLFYASEETAVEVVLKTRSDALEGDCADYPMEPENKAQIHALLPEHVRSIGPIIGVRRIFELTIR